MIKQIDILNTYGVIGVDYLKASVRKVSATHKTEQSIRYEVKEQSQFLSLRYYGREFFSTLETGRGPRKSSQYQGYDKSLEEYLTTRGITSKTSKSGTKYFKLGKSWMSAKSLAYKINKEGDSVYRHGGRIVYSPILDKLINEIKKEVTKSFVSNEIEIIRNIYKK